MHALATAIAILVIVGALVGFWRSLWRPPSRGGGDRPFGAITGETIPGDGPLGGHGGHDSGHGGVDGGSG